MDESVDLDTMIAHSRRTLLRHNLVQHVRRHRRFQAYLVNKVQSSVKPGPFLEVFDTAVKPIILVAQQCRLSVSKEQLPDIERVASDPTDSTQSYQPNIARSLLKKWSDAGATPAAWLDTFTSKVKSPVNDHLVNDTIRTTPAAWASSFIFTTKPDDVEVDLTSEAVNTPLFWWWLLCGGLGIESVFMMDPAMVSAPSFWARTIDPADFVGNANFAERFARRQTARSTRVAMRMSNSLRLTTVAAAPTIEKLYRLAVQTAVITKGQAEHDALAAKYLPNGGE